jgi:endonuclease YncB( thermonuclease family)
MKKLFLLVLLPLSLIVGCTPLQSERPATYQATIERVVDGDTVHLQSAVLGTKKVRLLSIDAPETNYQGKKQSPHGEQAKEHLQSLLPAGTRVTILTDRETTDDYGRLLAHIQKGNININQRMLSDGYAVTYFLYPNQRYFQSYQRAYVEARKNQRGIWNAEDPLQELPFEFRMRVSYQKPTKYVGDYDRKVYVSPDEYEQIAVEKRLFFFTEREAKDAGYKKR